MIKKIVFALSLLLMSAVTWADNFYMGPQVIFQNANSSASTYNGLATMLSAGFTHEFSPDIFMGSEINVTLLSVTLHEDTNDGYNNISPSHNYAISLLPGFNVTEDLKMYFRIGAIGTSFGHSSAINAAVQYGFGFQMPLADTWDIRAEYDHANYSRANPDGINIQTNVYGIGFVHRFE